MGKKNSESIVKNIATISKFSYEPTIKKYPFLEHFFINSNSPEEDWTLYLTTAGIGYICIIEGEDSPLCNKILEELGNTDGGEAIANATTKFISAMAGIIETRGLDHFPVAIGIWILNSFSNEKPQLKELESFPYTIVELFENIISSYKE